MLIFFCGKMGAGKSTMAKKLAVDHSAVLISEDEWLSKLYPNEIASFDDYLKLSARLKPLLCAHVRSLLSADVTVIMDFPANTQKQRAWFKKIFGENEFSHQLIYLEAADELCLQRIAQRRLEQPERQQFDNEQVFRQVTQFFEVPKVDEGFNIEVIGCRMH